MALQMKHFKNVVTMKNERWLPVVDCPGYEISNYGRLRSVKNYRILKGGKTKEGYIKHFIAGKHKKAHALVLEAFVGPRPPKNDACHNDGNPKNNHVSNLRWGTS